jgi:hypothetical protein
VRSFTTRALLICGLAVASNARAQTAAPEPRDSGAAALATRGDIDRALLRYAHEPTVEAVVSAALQTAPGQQAASLASRARSAGWVPRLAVRARRGQALDLSAPNQEDTLRVKSNDDLTLEASLSFELDRLFFRTEEVALLRQHRTEQEQRVTLAGRVVALYFERRRLQLERDLDPLPDVARSARIAEIGALLDVFTNGAFQRMIDSTRWTTGARTREPRSPSPRNSKPTATR